MIVLYYLHLVLDFSFCMVKLHVHRGISFLDTLALSRKHFTMCQMYCHLKDVNVLFNLLNPKMYEI